MVHRLNTHPFAEVPVAPFAHTHGFLVCMGNLTRHFLKLVFPTVKDHFAIEFQSTHVGALLGIDMVQYLGVGEIAVRGTAWRDS